MSATTTLARSEAPVERESDPGGWDDDASGPPRDEEPRPDTNVERARRGLAAVVHVASWFYLSVIAFLLGWVAVAWALMGWTPNIVSSGSMQPAISPGDVVMTVEPAADLEFEEGTVVTFDDPARAGELLTHRIVARNDDGTYRTRGDGNQAADSADLDPEDVVGVGRLLIPAVGMPVVWFDQGRIVVLGAWLVVSGLAVWGAVRVFGREDPGADDVPA